MRLSPAQRDVLAILSHGDHTCTYIARRLNLPSSEIWLRLRFLRKCGLIWYVNNRWHIGLTGREKLGQRRLL